VLDEQSAGIRGAGFAAVAENLPDGVVIVDRAGRIVYGNQQAAELTGYTQEELRSLRVEDLLPVHLRAVHEGHREAYLRGPRLRRMGSGLDLWLSRRDGSLLPVDIALNAVDGSDGPLVIAAIRDDGARREADQMLREQGHLLEAAHDAFLARRFGDDAVTFWNQGAVRTYGYSRTEALGTSLHQLLATRFPGSREAIDQALIMRGQWEGELTQVTRDRRVIVVESRKVLLRDRENRPVTVFQVNRDVTQARQDRDRVAAALEISTAVTAEEELAAVAALVAEQTLGMMRAWHGVAILPEGATVVTAIAPSAPVDGLVSAVAANAQVNRVMADGQPLRLDHLSLRWHGREMAGPAVAAPVDGRSNGMLMAVGRPGTLYDPHDLDALHGFALSVAGAVERARLREQLRRVALVEDRERIARSLHDTVIKNMFGVALHLQGAATRSPDPELRGELEASVADIDRAIADLRSYVFRLRSDAPLDG
jgi:PAS domain S-box-containing protein